MIVPLLAFAFGVDIRYAIGASLVSVIATSSVAAAAYVKEGISNIRIGMFLEIATTLGAVSGLIQPPKCTLVQLLSYLVLFFLYLPIYQLILDEKDGIKVNQIHWHPA